MDCFFVVNFFLSYHFCFFNDFWVLFHYHLSSKCFGASFFPVAPWLLVNIIKFLKCYDFNFFPPIIWWLFVVTIGPLNALILILPSCYLVTFGLYHWISECSNFDFFLYYWMTFDYFPPFKCFLSSLLAHTFT